MENFMLLIEKTLNASDCLSIVDVLKSRISLLIYRKQLQRGEIIPKIRTEMVKLFNRIKWKLLLIYSELPNQVSSVR
jgi:hypothetical protein